MEIWDRLLKNDREFITMVRVPGTSGDLVVHRGSLGKDVKINTEPGIEDSDAKGSPQTRKMNGSPDCHSFGRGSDNKKSKEGDQSPDLEDEP